MTTRLSVNINEDCAYTLKEISSHHRISITEVVRRSISSYKFIFDELRKGNTICIRDNRGRYMDVDFYGE